MSKKLSNYDYYHTEEIRQTSSYFIPSKDKEKDIPKLPQFTKEEIRLAKLDNLINSQDI